MSSSPATLHLCAYNLHSGELLLSAFTTLIRCDQVRLICCCFASIYSVKLNTLIHNMLDPISIGRVPSAWLPWAALCYVPLFLPLPVMYNERFRWRGLNFSPLWLPPHAYRRFLYTKQDNCFNLISYDILWQFGDGYGIRSRSLINKMRVILLGHFFLLTEKGSVATEGWVIIK